MFHQWKTNVHMKMKMKWKWHYNNHGPYTPITINHSPNTQVRKAVISWIKVFDAFDNYTNINYHIIFWRKNCQLLNNIMNFPFINQRSSEECYEYRLMLAEMLVFISFPNILVRKCLSCRKWYQGIICYVFSFNSAFPGDRYWDWVIKTEIL